MDGRAKLAAVLLGGYLLGRTKKMKLALTVAGAIGGKQLMNNRQDIVSRATKVLDSSPEAKRLVNEVTGTLVQAARGAALTAASKGVSSLSTNLQDRAEKLRSPQEAAGKATETATGAAGKGKEAAGKVGGPALGFLKRKSRRGRAEEEAPEEEAPRGEAAEEEPEEGEYEERRPEDRERTDEETESEEPEEAEDEGYAGEGEGYEEEEGPEARRDEGEEEEEEEAPEGEAYEEDEEPEARDRRRESDEEERPRPSGDRKPKQRPARPQPEAPRQGGGERRPAARRPAPSGRPSRKPTSE